MITRARDLETIQKSERELRFFQGETVEELLYI